MNENLTPLTYEALTAWWTNTPGAQRFLQHMASMAEHCYAIVADITKDDTQGFITIFTEVIQRRNYSTVVEHYDLDIDHGEENFVTDLTARFAPHYVPDLMSSSMITDVAAKGILSGYIIFVKVDTRLTWLTNLVSNFNKVESSDKGALIFLTSDTMPSQITMKLTDYILPYDVQFFAINLLEDTNLTQIERLFTATLASKLAGTSAIIAKNLASAELYSNGRKLAKEVLGEDFSGHKFERVLWETQIQFALPIVETVRERLIARNQAALKKILPVADEFGKFLESPWDMELRHLHFYGGSNKLFTQTDWELLEMVYRIRNDLTHLFTVDTERLQKLFLLANLVE